MTVYDCCLYIDEIGALTQRLATALRNSSTSLLSLRFWAGCIGPSAGVGSAAAVVCAQAVGEEVAASSSPRLPLPAPLRSSSSGYGSRLNPLLGLEHIGRRMADLERGDTVVLSNVWDIPSPSWLSQQVGAASAKSAQFVVADAAAPDETAGNVRVGGVAVTVDATNLTRPSRILKQAFEGRAGTPGAEFVGIRVEQRRRGPGDGADSDRDPRPMIICAYLRDEDGRSFERRFRSR